MPYYKEFNISILENNSNKSLEQIVLHVHAELVKDGRFKLIGTDKIELGKTFLQAEGKMNWSPFNSYFSEFNEFPDVCFCITACTGDINTECRVLMFNGKSIMKYREMLYKAFNPMDFE